jgi:hypothetical protein
MDKAHIIAEIQRTAAANDGRPLGRQRLEAETGISDGDWGRYWARFGDAVVAAGFAPNTFGSAYDDDWLIEQLIQFIRELGHYPVAGELRVHSHNNPSFPSKNTFHRLGTKKELAAKIIDYCARHGDCDDIVAICQPIVDAPEEGEKGSELFLK